MKFLAIIATAFAFLGIGSSAEAQVPMEYVRVCTDGGANYYYIPGTETCVNAQTGETREYLEYGNPSAGYIGGQTKLAERVGDAERRIGEAFDGASIAAALQDPSLASGETGGVRLNWGNAGNANAFGVSGALVINDNAFDKGVRVTGSGGVAFTRNKIGGNAGLQATW